MFDASIDQRVSWIRTQTLSNEFVSRSYQDVVENSVIGARYRAPQIDLPRLVTGRCIEKLRGLLQQVLWIENRQILLRVSSVFVVRTAVGGCFKMEQWKPFIPLAKQAIMNLGKKIG